MSDQMPDEVWTDPINNIGWGVYTMQETGVCTNRYIRADLYERAEAERDDAKARVEHLLTEICGGAANRHALAERCREVTAERDRLREAVSEAKRRIGIYMDDECSYDETLEMGRFVLDAFHGLQEALDHD